MLSVLMIACHAYVLSYHSLSHYYAQLLYAILKIGWMGSMQLKNRKLGEYKPSLNLENNFHYF